MKSNAARHTWQFRARFRRGAFGWRSQPAISRIKEALAEIRAVARRDALLGAEGAVLLIEKLSPALEHVDGSSGAIGNCVNQTISALVEIIATAPAEPGIRAKWLTRLFEAHAQDEIPYIESLAEHWGTLCAGPELASHWADELLSLTRHVLHPPGGTHEFFHGTSACLSALFAAGRHDELRELLQDVKFWPYRRWAVRALIAEGKGAEAIRLAEGSRDAWANLQEIDQLCEEVLLASGLVDEAYRRYGLRANATGPTYTAWLRVVTRKYPHKQARQVLADLVAQSPDEAGKWFAAAKDCELFDEAIALAQRSPCSPQTLTRAARDFAQKRPQFAVEAGIAALHWLVEGYGYRVTNLDVLSAYSHTMNAAKHAESVERTQQRIRELVAKETFGERFVTKVLGNVLGLE